MAVTLPPVPIGEKENSYLWMQWYLKLQQLLASDEGIAWALVDKSGSDIADIANRDHADLQNMQGGTAGERFHLTSAQHTVLTAGIAAGTYTPTLTNVTNLDASTAYQAQYLRVGNTVTVSGKVDVNPNAAGACELGITLPLASNFAATEDCAGTACWTAVAQESAAILADTTNDRASMQWIATDTANRTVAFTFTFQVI